MPKSTRGGRRANTISTSNPVAKATTMTDAEAQQLRDDQDDMYYGTVSDAIKLYISKADADGMNYSRSQVLNFLEKNGIDIQNATASDVNKFYASIGSSSRISDKVMSDLQIMQSYIPQAVHPIGKDTLLYRGSHVDDLSKFGITNTNLSLSQLQKQLIGGTISNTAYMSTSYDKNKSPFLSGSLAGGREVVYEIKAGKNTNVVFGAKSQAEIIVDKGTKFKITDVKKTGRTATPRMGTPMDQILITLETY